MSLLLDALKKAAEQKAKKNRDDSPTGSHSDETEVDLRPDRDDEPGGYADGRLHKPRGEDEDRTEYDPAHGDQTEHDTRADATRVESETTRVESEETRPGVEATRVDAEPTRVDSGAGHGFDAEDDTRTLATQMETGEDETIVFTTDDEVTGGREPTELADLMRDQTEVTDAGGSAEERTETRTGVFDEDETELSQYDTTVHDPADGTEYLVDETSTQTREQTGVPPERDEAPDEDLSLLLIERDDTGFTQGTSVTDPQARGDQLNTLREGNFGDDELALVDTTRHRAPADVSTTRPGIDSGATTTRNADTMTGQTTTARADAGGRTATVSTQTYAPDNYDRTLMKLPNEDASRLFAGMKSDSDVVMTPDYAKKVFQSKSSAQRMHHYKVYAGIACAILLAIAVFGLFEMQQESENIDTSLRPLKRDPMPGVIRPAKDEPAGLTLSEDQINSQTIAMIESAGAAAEEPVADEGAIAGGETTGPGSTDSTAEPEPVTEAESGTRAETASPASTGTAGQAAPPSGETAAQAASGTSLEITIGRQAGQKQVWLREAYAAYQAGNYDTALARYNQVLGVDPVNRNALLARAAIRVQNNEIAGAVDDYHRLLLANPKDSLAMTSLISVANYSPAESESRLKLMIRDEPDSPYLNFALANVYGAQNRWPEAQRHYFVALENNPDDPNYAYNLAVSLEHIKKPDVAIAYYERALDNFENGIAIFSREIVDQRLEVLRKL